MPGRSTVRAPSLRVTAAIVLLALLWLAMLTVGTGDSDDDILRALYVGREPLLVAVARALTWLGDWRVVIALSLAASVWLAIARSWRSGLAVLVVTLIGRALVSAQKYGIERMRPGDEAHLVPVSTPSFPSGHSAGAVIVYLTLALVIAGRGRWKWPAVTAALLVAAGVGVSRVMLGVHWPTDVVGGWAFGLLWVLLVLPLAERLAGE
jgi:undecaprenyl-diphosphatase